MHDPRWKTAAKTAASLLNRPLAAMRIRRLLAATEPPWRIHLGAGPVQLPGWISSDVSWQGRYYLDATRPWPTGPGTVELVYADNVIEHVRMEPARAWLRYMHAAMQPGAVVRLVTPDIERIARMYLDRPEDAETMMRRNAEAGYRVHHPVDILTNTFTEWGHHRGYLWDWSSLSHELSEAGFVQIARREVGESPVEALSRLEQRAARAEAAATLVVEATRPDD